MKTYMTDMYHEGDDGDETLVHVEYTITPYDPGVSIGPAENCYPPEGGEVEIVSVTAAGAPYAIDDKLRADWQTKIYEQHAYDDGPDPDDRRDRDRDDRLTGDDR